MLGQGRWGPYLGGTKPTPARNRHVQSMVLWQGQDNCPAVRTAVSRLTRLQVPPQGLTHPSCSSRS
jgi:hypothetical protein